MTTVQTDTPNLRGLVSQYFGIVNGVDELEIGPGDARIHYAVAYGGDSTPAIGTRSPSMGSGAHISRQGAIDAAVGELLERYSAAFVDESRMVFGTRDQIRGASVDPGRFALFADYQYGSPEFPFAPFTDGSRLWWIKATDLAGNDQIYVPAQLVYMSHDRGRSEDAIGYATSSGLAAGRDFRSAATAALLELLERDAFMLTWFNRLSLPLIDISSNAGLARKAQERFFVPGLEHFAIDLSSFHGVPTVLAVVKETIPRQVALTCGAASSPRPEDCWLKAITEAYHTRALAKRALESGASIPSDPEDIRTFEQHMLYYTSQENVRMAEFLFESDSSRSLDDIPYLSSLDANNVLECLIDDLSNRGISVYGVDVTAPDIAESGLTVVRVLCPELCGIYSGVGREFLGTKRVSREPVRLGIRQKSLAAHELNLSPHPFP